MEILVMFKAAKMKCDKTLEIRGFNGHVTYSNYRRNG